jgi:hypothetical protein
MRGKLWFLGGLAAGFVLGARAGREKYEEIVQKARQVKDHPTVQEAAGVVQEQATRLVAEGKDKLSHTKVGERLLSSGSGARSTELGTASTEMGTPSTVAGKSATGATTSVGSTDSTLAGSSSSSTRPNSASSGSGL